MSDSVEFSAGGSGSDSQSSRASLRWSLSNKLLLATLAFVMVAEVLIYIPSIANYRNFWLQEKLDAAALVAMAAQAGSGSLPIDMEERMLASIGVEAIALRSHGQRWLVSASAMPNEVAAEHDLTAMRPLDSIGAAFTTLLSTDARPMMVRGAPPPGSDRFEIVVTRDKLRNALLVYSRNVLLVGLAISAITASLLYMLLRVTLVRPIQRLSASIVAFSRAPDDPSTRIAPSGRSDEIGLAEERLAAMQATLRELLKQRRHLADLGLAVSKINHDLRNILASAQLFSDRLEGVEDPRVKRFAPKIVQAIDRAIGYTRAVLAYGQAVEEPPQRRLVCVRTLADDVADTLGLPAGERVVWENRVPAGLEADGDPEQLFRLLANLCRNAVEAFGDRDGDDPSVIRRLWIEGERTGGFAALRICDTGPGVPARARETLFEPFRGSARPGGTGLGLAIAAEIVRAHGGGIRLLDRPGAGAVFEVTIPDRPVNLAALRQVRAG